MPEPETLIKRHVMRHDCLPNFLGDGDKSGGKVTREEKTFSVLDLLMQPRQDENLF
jgi:hypothetical protein